MKTPLLVVLDLDETLFHSTATPLEGRKHDFRVGSYYTYKRPGVAAFLKALFADKRFSPAVFTAASRDYATVALRGLGVNEDDLTLFFSDERLVRSYVSPDSLYYGQSHYYFFKDLKKVRNALNKWSYKRMVAVDDLPRNFHRQYSNLVLVKPYEGQAEENPFPKLLAFLGHLAELDNVRPTEKRGWQRKEW